MHGVTIYDAPELAPVLAALGDEALTCEWLCSEAECYGGRAEEIHDLSDSRRRVSGRELLTIASGVSQTIDGYFHAFRPGSSEPWVIIRAVEGDFDVRSDDPAVFARVHAHFQRVDPFPSDELA